MTNETPTWTAMADSPPPVDTPILVRASNGAMVVAEFNPEDFGAIWGMPGVSAYDAEWDWEQSRQPFAGVTHWMPLPPQPEQDAGETEFSAAFASASPT